jgi:hypothetical protein
MSNEELFAIREMVGTGVVVARDEEAALKLEREKAAKASALIATIVIRELRDEMREIQKRNSYFKS